MESFADTLDLFHSLPVDEAFKQLRTSPQGLKDQQIKQRQEIFGKNVLEEKKQSYFAIFVRQFKGTSIYILFVASLVSVFIGEWIDFGVIIGIILINGAIGFWQESKAQASIDALKKMTETKNQVIRNGQYQSIASSELVPGDYIVLEEGEVITADVRLTSSTSLMVDESMMTGESIPVTKDHDQILPQKTLLYDLSNMVLAGTIIVRGSGYGVVVNTGGETYLASIAKKAEADARETPLNKSLNRFMQKFVFALIIVFAILGVVGMIQGRRLVDLGYILLAGLVSAVPEGLTVVVTLVLVLGAIALSKKQTLVRYLASVGVLGDITIFASDKTGTITEGKLIVKEVYAKNLETLKQIAALCCNAFEGSGDPLDVALANWVGKYEEIQGAYPRIWEHPFDTRLMLMATANKIDGSEKLFIKGAFEALKEKSDNYDQFTNVLNSFLEKGLRVLAFGQGEWLGNESHDSWKIQIIGLIGFLDPPKPGVLEAVISAKKAGIHVMMITGDHPATAKAIAKEVNIWTEGDQVLTGKEIETLSDKALIKALKKATVLARALPEHKYRIVDLLQQTQEIVAVTGDGVNDVPALKIADIGIAMGSGTEAAKNVAEMIITDNNLKVIVGAIKNARIIADNIRKVVYYLISATLQELVLLVLAISINLPLPLEAIQILWINLIGSGVQDKIFPFAKEEGDVMKRKPRRSDNQFFDLSQIIHILTFGLGVGLLSFLLYVHLIRIYPPVIVSTIIFTSVILSHWANGIQAQKENEPFFKNIRQSFLINPYIYMGIALGLALQCSLIYLIPDLFSLSPIPLICWKYPLGMFLCAFGVVELRKWIEYRKRSII
jgi:Ca2+-transporting ATPase